MNKVNRTARFFLFVSLMLGSAGLRAADWPQWGGTENRNMVSDEQPVARHVLARRRERSVDRATRSTHLRQSHGGGGRVFVGTDAEGAKDDPRFGKEHPGVVKCLSEATGELLWQLVVPERKHGLPVDSHFVQQEVGICSSPTVDGDRVYLVTTAAEIVCLDVKGMENGNDGPFTEEGAYMAGHGNPPVEVTPRDADIIWRVDLIDDVGIMPHDAASCSVLIQGDFLYTSTSNGVGGMQGETFFSKHAYVVRPEAPAIIVLDKHTGQLVARERAGISARLFHAQWSSPSCGTVRGKTLVFFGGGDGFCYAFEALTAAGREPVDLKLVWSYDCNPPEYRYRDGQLIEYYDGDRRKTNGLNKNDESYVGPSEVIATPVFHQGRIYVAIGQDPAHGNGVGMLHCIDATQEGDITKTGCIWTYRDIQRTIATAAVADGVVYIPDVTGKIHGVDAETGQRRWLYDTNAETWGGAFVADGKLYLGNQRSFYIFTAGSPPELLSKIQLGQPAYSTPIAANGRVYVASQRHLWAVALSR